MLPVVLVCIFFFQGKYGIRDLVRSRGLGDVYKRQSSVGGSNWGTNGTLTIGRRNDGATWFVGDLAEVVMTDATLGATDRADLENYLRAKWGTP